MTLDHPKKILVIDDEAHIRQSFAYYLEDHGYDVLTAENGVEGLEMIGSGNPDLVLMDLRMPGMDGLAVLKEGKKQSPDLPMIVISGANRVADVVQALRYGAWDYLEKPVQDLSILLHAIEKALEKARLVSENRAYQQNLETMVRERTCQLKNANAHLHDINTRLHRVVETTQGLTGCLDMKQFGVRVLKEFAGHTTAEGGSLYLVEKKGLRLMHTLDPDHAPEFLPFPLAEGSVFHRVVTLGEVLLVKNIGEEAGVEPSGWSGYGDGSLLAFPIRDSRGTQMGVIALHRKKTPPFSDEDKEVGAILASYSCETIRAIKAFEEARKSERQLRHSHKMEAIGTLAGGIAHDFNNILSGIMGFAELAKMENRHPEKALGHIDRILEGAQRAGDLVAQILTFSRGGESEMCPLKLHLTIKEAVKFLRSSIPSTISIVEEISSKSTVMANPTQIYQVTMNLCTNAYHAMRETGGTLSVSLEDVILQKERFEEVQSSGPHVLLKIEDTGFGIEPALLDRIFDPYFTTKKITQGTGLGLAVVSGIVESHQGIIRVSSQKGRGTVFRVFFPVLADGDSRGVEYPNGGTEGLEGNETVMVVDDEPGVVTTTQKILSKMGYTVLGFTDSATALQVFEADPDRIDIVVSDMTMPKMDGRVLSEKILALRRDLPVIVCTGFHDTFTEDAALDMGIRRYLQKPVVRQTLVSAIRQELDRRG